MQMRVFLEGSEHQDTGREEGQGKTKGRDWNVPPQEAEERQEPAEAGRGQEEFCPGASGGSVTVLTP